LLVIEYQWSREHQRAVRTSLRSFCEWACGENIVDDNVALCLPKVRPAIPAPRPAPDRIWHELLAKATPRERVMALLAAEAGLRRAEVAQVNYDDLIEEIHGWSLIVRGKGSKQRVVPITARLAAEIRTYCGSCCYGYLFPGQIGGHISPRRVGQLISALMPDGYSIHKLRHRFSSRAYAGTRDLRALKEVLGHSSIATTEIYVATSSREMRLVAEAAGADSGDVA
jgi:integrase